MPPEELRNSLKTNHRLHWYLVDKVLGQGGFGITYLAHDPNLDQFVAVKEYLPMELAVRDGDNSVYPASEANGERYKWGLDRFISEARTLAKFKHPAIVRVLSVFEENNTAYMVMEYERGQSLQQVIDQRRTLPEQELMQIIGPLLDGLEVIHASGFIHRDIKPANIYIRRDGSPVLLDFGSARQALGEQTKSLTSIVSPGYAPFEQYYSKSDKQGPWTDIYSLAATTYRAITGLMPMDAIDRSEAILKAEKDAFISAEVIGKGKYSPQFLKAIDNGLHFSEKKRPQTVDEWRTQLGIERGGGSYSRRLEDAVTLDNDIDSKTRFDAPSSPPDPISESQIETQIATRVQGESLEPNDLPAVGHSADRAPSGVPNSQIDSQGVASAPASQAVAVAPKTNWFSLILLSLLALVTGGGLLAGFSGEGDFIANVKSNIAGLTGQQQSVGDLVAKGDRALAAGKVYEPFEGSALDYYRRAAIFDPRHPSARQGIELTAPEVLSALSAAIAASDLDTAEKLYGYLESLPYQPFELEQYAEQIASKHRDADAAARDTARINDFLKAADEDIQAGRLVSPANGNALLKFRAVLLLDPDNTAAKAGIEEIEKRLTAQFKEQVAKNNFSAAEKTLSDFSAITHDADANKALVALLEDKRKALQQETSKADSIKNLLRLADEDLAAVRLASPRNRNAFDRYQQVLALDPGNASATAGIAAVASKYVELANIAVKNRDGDKLRSYLSRLNKIAPTHSAIPALKSAQQEISQQVQAKNAALALEQERIRLEEESRARAEQQQRMEAQRLQQKLAEEERRRAQEAEAKRLFEEGERKAQLAKAEEVASLDKISTVVVEFDGFDDQLELYGLRRREVRADVEAILKKSGYLISLHHEAMRIPGARLVIVRFRANLNSASGVFSYASSIALYDNVAYWPLDRHRTKLNPLWERGNSGVAVQTELAKVRREYKLIAERLVHEVGQAPRVKRQ